jgi:EAL domain-containing protein (putative c-di-GMP-specific phosphodiesterase class I)
MEMEKSLHTGVPIGELELYFQPLVDIKRNIECFEALLRWQHPNLGFLSPGDFVHVAEETGFIVPMGAWVLEEACRHAASWQIATGRDIRVAVNVSALQFYHSDFGRTVRDTLVKTHLPARLLELELTESAVMCNFDEASRLMNSLRELGVTIAIDDFGTGYSSLNSLRRLPADTLKIDRSFLSDVEDQNSLAIVRAITSLARSLRLNVVAEGIETEAQFAAVSAAGVDLVQGFLCGEPRSASRTLARLEASATPPSPAATAELCPAHSTG